MNMEIKTVEGYISTFPAEIREILETLREIVLENAPDAVERMAYGMPAYSTHGKPLVYFAAFKKHIGFYATPTGHSEFAAELSGFKQGKGSVQFPYDGVPYDLVKRLVRFRVQENEKQHRDRNPRMP